MDQMRSRLTSGRGMRRKREANPIIVVEGLWPRMCVIEMEIAMEMWLGIYTGKAREEGKPWKAGCMAPQTIQGRYFPGDPPADQFPDSVFRFYVHRCQMNSFHIWFVMLSALLQYTCL